MGAPSPGRPCWWLRPRRPEDTEARSQLPPREEELPKGGPLAASPLSSVQAEQTSP